MARIIRNNGSAAESEAPTAKFESDAWFEQMAQAVIDEAIPVERELVVMLPKMKKHPVQRFFAPRDPDLAKKLVVVMLRSRSMPIKAVAQ